MALTKIDDRGLTTPIDLLDNEKIRFGTGNDLELYHDGTNSFIDNAGSLKVQSNYVYINDAEGNNHIRCEDGSYVSLHFNGSKKLETTSTGVSISGELQVEDVEGTTLRLGNTAAAASDGDYLSGIDFHIKDNNDATGAVCAAIRSHADQNHTATAKGTYLTLHTTDDDTTTLDERIRITHDGNVGIGTTSPTEKLHAIGQVGGTNPTAGSKWDIARFVAHDYSPTNSGGLTIGAYWNNSDVSGRKAYIQSSQNTNSGSTVRELALNPDGGNVSIGDGNLVVANGHGIDFSATAHTNADDSTLDDYERGGFNPTVGGSTSTGTKTYTHQSGYYVKIGKVVHCWVDITIASASGMSGVFAIQSLPYAKTFHDSQNSYYEGGSFWFVEEAICNEKPVAAGYMPNGYSWFYCYSGDDWGGKTTFDVNTTGRVAVYFAYTAS